MKKKSKWVMWGVFALCFVALIISVILILPSLLADDIDSAEKIDKRYKNINLYTTGDAWIWPWEYLAESERSYEIEIDGIKYRKFGTVSEEFVGDKIGNYTIVGYDAITKEQHTTDCTMYQLKDVKQTEFMAGIITDKYYIFMNDVYNPPQTLGELFDRVDLSQFVKLERFSENNLGPSAKHFILNDDKYVWEVLSHCNEATYIDQDQAHWHMYDREFISFSISSEPLPIYKQSFTITNDGYLWTNAFQWGYLYYIGEETSEKIIKYAKGNSKKAEYEPYNNDKYIYGTIVEITDEYMVIDDSNLCKKEADGITYKVLLNDIRISRYIDRGIAEIGDKVQVSYKGEIDKENSNTISTAFSMNTVYISQSN